ncbi:uncharacterized protein Z518_09439 [Rhinocladiella mackenziei CBS 650.93]|uniref:Uncharacterized protein n=1 Tax=Rhinocladiella mackenziei CBS 650.93 TaxID=1442369 RepID=A0A0D2GTQ3_9EURO|nr:uncharacterized protein Z518_09439 [Rhinocladiella mackenziei CBS 650.93]KIX01713.1 hypothetical protein Z518_09439 [Rhinocladiella mackenziei CBS 650.93]
MADGHALAMHALDPERRKRVTPAHQPRPSATIDRSVNVVFERQYPAFAIIQSQEMTTTQNLDCKTAEQTPPGISLLRFQGPGISPNQRLQH